MAVGHGPYMIPFASANKQFADFAGRTYIRDTGAFYFETLELRMRNCFS